MLLALAAMIVLFAVGLRLGELRWMHVVYCLVAAIFGLFVFAAFNWHPIGYTAILAGIDIILILAIFKSDIVIR
jgi:hypothetical protein